MAGASMNGIKSRIKSVKSTMQITKAMELVATSKLRRAKERAERCRPYYEAMTEAIDGLITAADAGSPYFSEKDGKTLIVLIAGDRGLAGGYNANVIKIAEMLARECDAIFLPIGKKAVEYCRHREKPIFLECESVADIGVGKNMELGRRIVEAYLAGKFTKVKLVFTKFASMISQVPVYEDLLPILRNGDTSRDVLTDCNPEELLERLVPEYIGGILYAATAEAVASECGSRRTAMNSANKNASEMIDTLMLKYNRARQAVITQEITEIVSGSEAL